MFLQFPEPVLGRTHSTRKNSVRVAEFFGIGITGACSAVLRILQDAKRGRVLWLLASSLFMGEGWGVREQSDCLSSSTRFQIRFLGL